MHYELEIPLVILSNFYFFLYLLPCRPVIDPIASIFHRMICGRSDASNDAEDYDLGSEHLPGSDPIEASRRR